MQQQQNNLPPYVRFAVVAVEDKSRILAEGRYGYKNLEMAHITRPGQRDTVVKEAQQWLSDLEKQVADERIPREWLLHFRKQYEAWKAGVEAPVDGTPIRGWPVLLPALQEELCQLGILTVEQLAAANMEVISRIGIGGMELKKKAENWLAVAGSTGKAAAEVEKLQLENRALTERVAALEALVQKQQPAEPALYTPSPKAKAPSL